jgi:hypothetical protein
LFVKLKSQVEIKEVLEAKVVRLESKVSGLESKIQQQNSLIATLQKEWQSEEMDMKLHGIKQQHAKRFSRLPSLPF